MDSLLIIIIITKNMLQALKAVMDSLEIHDPKERNRLMALFSERFKAEMEHDKKDYEELTHA